MGLEIVWSNLGLIAGPFVGALLVSAGLAWLLRRAASRSRRSPGRDNCSACRSADEPCDAHRALDEVAVAPLALFVACSTFALLALAFPEVVATYIVPFGAPTPTVTELLLLIFLMCASGGAVALSAFVLQDRREHRELLLRGSVVASIAGLVLGTLGAGSLGDLAQGLAPAALSILLVALVLEWRARHGRPALGIRAIAAAVSPLFVIAVIAAVRIAEILRYAAQT